MENDPIPEQEPEEPVSGLTGTRTLALARHPIRTREGRVTRSGWRLTATSAEGDGAVVLVEDASGESFYRGEGVFLGWSRERLKSAYESLLPRAEGPDFQLSQLG